MATFSTYGTSSDSRNPLLLFRYRIVDQGLGCGEAEEIYMDDYIALSVCQDAIDPQ